MIEGRLDGRRGVHPGARPGPGRADRAPRVFQAIYTVLWYLLINDTSALDFMGTLREHGRLTGPSPALWAAAAAAGVAAALTRASWRETRR